MLAIRLQRTGRSGHAQFRMIVQDSRFSPKRGRIVAYLGSYDPHTKSASINSQEAAKYLENGAQPSDSAARLLQKEGVKLPAWVKLEGQKQRTVRNPEKRRSTVPAAPEAPIEAPTEPAVEKAAEEPVTEQPVAQDNAPEPIAEEPAEAKEEASETPAPEAEAPAAEPADEPTEQS